MTLTPRKDAEYCTRVNSAVDVPPTVGGNHESPVLRDRGTGVFSGRGGDRRHSSGYDARARAGAANPQNRAGLGFSHPKVVPYPSSIHSDEVFPTSAMSTAIVIEPRFAEGHYERFPELFAELVGLKVDALTMCAWLSWEIKAYLRL